MMQTIFYPLLGGVLIGISSSTLLFSLGQISGISGIVASTIPPFIKKSNSEISWRYAFLIGLLMGGAILLFIKPELFNYSLNASLQTTILAGLLVGYGTRLGSGCTSGHGVCGLARLSKRSFVATLVFMFFGIITVALKGII